MAEFESCGKLTQLHEVKHTIDGIKECLAETRLPTAIVSRRDGEKCDGTCIHVANVSMRNLLRLELTGEDPVKMDCFTPYHPHELSMIHDFLKTSAEHPGEFFHLEHRVRCGGGNDRWVQGAYMTIFMPSLGDDTPVLLMQLTELQQ